MPDVAVCVSGTDGHSEVALRVGALNLEGDGLRATRRKQDVSVEFARRVRNGGEAHVDEFQYAEAGESLVSAVHVAFAVGLPGAEIYIVVNHRRPQVAFLAIEDFQVAVADGVLKHGLRLFCRAHGVVVGEYLNRANGVGDMGVGTRCLPLFLRISLVERHREVGKLRTGGSVGSEGDEVFGEGPVAVVAEPLRHDAALRFKGVAVKDVAGADYEMSRILHHHLAQGVVGELVVHRADDSRLAGLQAVGDVHLAALGVGHGVGDYPCMRETLVNHSLVELLCARLGQCTVVNHRRFAELAHPAVVPFRGVVARHIVDAQLELDAPKQFVVGKLAHIVYQLVALEQTGGVVLYVHGHLVEQELTLRHVASRGACRQYAQQQRAHP